METMKKTLVAIACVAIPAAVVAACVKAANKIVDKAAEEDGLNPVYGATQEIGLDAGKPDAPFENCCKWWTGTHKDGNRELHGVTISTTEPLSQELFKAFTACCTECETAEKAVRKAMELIYSHGYTIVRTYVYDS